MSKIAPAASGSKMPVSTARPPASGTGASWILRRPGSSTRFARRHHFRQNGSASSVVSSALAKAAQKKLNGKVIFSGRASLLTSPNFSAREDARPPVEVIGRDGRGYPPFVRRQNFRGRIAVHDDRAVRATARRRSEEHTSELQSLRHLV